MILYLCVHILLVLPLLVHCSCVVQHLQLLLVLRGGALLHQVQYQCGRRRLLLALLIQTAGGQARGLAQLRSRTLLEDAVLLSLKFG